MSCHALSIALVSPPALQRLRAPDGSEVTPVPTPDAAPRSAFPAQRFPLHYGANEDIRQLRDLLQRHPDKMWLPREYRYLSKIFRVGTFVAD